MTAFHTNVFVPYETLSLIFEIGKKDPNFSEISHCSFFRVRNYAKLFVILFISFFWPLFLSFLLLFDCSAFLLSIHLLSTSAMTSLTLDATFLPQIVFMSSFIGVVNIDISIDIFRIVASAVSHCI